MDEPIIEGGSRKVSKKQKIIGAVIVVIVVAALGFFNWKQTTSAPPSSAEQNQDNSNSVGQEEANYPDLALLANLKKLELAKDFVSWTPDSKVSADQVKNLNLVQKGNLNEAYVYIKALVQDKKLTKYDSLYLKVNGQGGHLFRPASLALPESEQTELLYPLEKISYLPNIPYDESRTPNELNALNFFGDSKKINIYSFLSSWRTGKILELSIFYGCREGEECSLEIK